MKEEERKYWREVKAALIKKEIKKTKAAKALTLYRAVVIREGTLHLVYTKSVEETAQDIVFTQSLHDPEPFWRVKLICRGIYKEYITVQVPLWDNKVHDNRILTLDNAEIPEKLLAMMQLNMHFYAEVPKILHAQAEFVVKNFEIPNDATTVEETTGVVEEAV